MKPALQKEILELSESKYIDLAIKEWSLDNIFFAQKPQTCLCGHFPIKEICILHNSSNGKAAEVGNCCVKRFMNISSDKLFVGVKRIMEQITKSVNIEVLEHAQKKNNP